MTTPATLLNLLTPGKEGNGSAVQWDPGEGQGRKKALVDRSRSKNQDRSGRPTEDEGENAQEMEEGKRRLTASSREGPPLGNVVKKKGRI